MRQELDFKSALLGLGVVGVIGSIVVVKFVREAKEASACALRPRQPWDI